MLGIGHKFTTWRRHFMWTGIIRIYNMGKEMMVMKTTIRKVDCSNAALLCHFSHLVSPLSSLIIFNKISRPSGLEADGSVRKRCPGWGVASAGTGKAQTLRNFTRGYHRFYYGGRRRNITQLAVLLNPRPPPELPPGLPAPTRQSCMRRGGHCVARPLYHSAGARDGEDRITWRCATIRHVSRPSPTIC